MKRAVLIATAALVLGGGLLFSGEQQPTFPHSRHEGLFPSCTTCHEGIETGEAARFVSVEPTLCRACHDGDNLPAVEWEGPTPRPPDNLRTVHPGHPEIGCTACHQIPGRNGAMDVQAARAENCLACHAPDATEHRAAGVPCLQCHRSLEDAPELSAAQIAAFPQPSDHGETDWLTVHGGQAETDVSRCSVCHARQSCTRCHVDPEGAPPVRSLALDERVARTEAKGAEPEVPGHGPQFATAHGAAAVAAVPNCSACHAESFCVDCHDSAGRPSFHPDNFLERHGAEAWSGQAECAECHAREVFCRDCHETQGVGPEARTAGGFHDADPNWFLSHGKAARQGLESCASCHQQTSCLRCHSAKEGFRINPHGPDFDADDVRGKSQESCGICHFEFGLSEP